jgi:glycosyltransferase involved in cell wall biosynthesis
LLVCVKSERQTNFTEKGYSMPLVSILTATYDRAKLLPRLYGSLLSQTCQNFEWLVIDDGSSDNTEMLVKRWKREGKITVRYMKKENGGKHTAINLGVGNIDSPLTFLLDSDDWIVENAVEQIVSYYTKYKDSSVPMCCFTFHRQTDGEINGGPFPEEVQMARYHEFQMNRWHGDTAQVFFTRVLRKFPFPTFQGVKIYISEDIVWIPMGFKYATVYIRKVIAFSEYLPEGMTKNLRAYQNYLAQYHRGLLYMHPRILFKYRLRGALMANVYARFCHIKPQKNTLILLMTVPGFLVYKIWKWKYKMEDDVVDQAVGTT